MNTMDRAKVLSRYLMQSQTPEKEKIDKISNSLRLDELIIGSNNNRQEAKQTVRDTINGSIFTTNSLDASTSILGESEQMLRSALK